MKKRKSHKVRLLKKNKKSSDARPSVSTEHHVLKDACLSGSLDNLDNSRKVLPIPFAVSCWFLFFSGDCAFV